MMFRFIEGRCNRIGVLGDRTLRHSLFDRAQPPLQQPRFRLLSSWRLSGPCPRNASTGSGVCPTGFVTVHEWPEAARIAYARLGESRQTAQQRLMLKTIASRF